MRCPVPKATQEDRILEILRDNRWHCSNEFVAAYMPRFSAVIHTLRHLRGYDIAGERCNLHNGSDHNVFMFRIRSYPVGERPREQMSWLPS